MTAYLQPGDKIHLAIPIPPTLHGPALHAAVEDARQTYAATYAQHGIEVTYFDVSTALPAPVVVAVFRATPGREGEQR